MMVLWSFVVDAWLAVGAACLVAFLVIVMLALIGLASYYAGRFRVRLVRARLERANRRSVSCAASRFEGAMQAAVKDGVIRSERLPRSPKGDREGPRT